MRALDYALANSMPSVPATSRSFPHSSEPLLDLASSPGKGSPWHNPIASILKMAMEEWNDVT